MTPSIINYSALNNEMWPSIKHYQLSCFSFWGEKKVSDILVTSWLVTSLFSLFRFRVVLCAQCRNSLLGVLLFSLFFRAQLIAKNGSRILCWWVVVVFFFVMHIFWANIQRVPGQDELLGNRVGFNSQDHMDECQNQPSVTCSCSWVSLERQGLRVEGSCLP